MNYIWIWGIPVLFLPNLSFGTETSYGNLAPTDYLIGPYILLVYFSTVKSRHRHVDKLSVFLAAFVIWAFFTTILINVRYNYDSYHPFYFSILKLTKFAVYGVLGVLITRGLSNARLRNIYHWSVLVTGSAIGAIVKSGV